MDRPYIITTEEVLQMEHDLLNSFSVWELDEKGCEHYAFCMDGVRMMTQKLLNRIHGASE